MRDHYDVLIVGAGLSGIGMACHLAMDCPEQRVGIIERRNAIGGTWDLFRYPGIRSDSDMFSFGYKFRPWSALKVLADGPAIRNYVNDTARQYGVDQKVQYGLKVVSANWSSEQKLWTLSALHEASGERRSFRCRFLVSCAGYYNYDKGYLPHFPGVERFKGQCIHPQHWPENLDYKGKRVVVIGSGATAVTLVPAMAPDTAHITMLQRSPGYIFSVPGFDKMSQVMQRFLPERWVYRFARWRNITLQRLIYKASRRWPERARALLLAGVRKQLGKDFDMRHFTPKYMPWDERLCAVPDADLFEALKSGKASVVTDQIETFTERGILLKSGTELEADIIVTATGLQVQTFGGAEVTIDGQSRPVNELMMYKSVMVQDVPNMGLIIGYTNAPWTLKADIASRYICRLLQHMRRNNLAVATARAPDGMADDGTVLGSLSSGYVRRAADMLPRQGKALPWRVLHNYEVDRVTLLDDPVDDGVLSFTAAPAGAALPRVEMAAA